MNIFVYAFIIISIIFLLFIFATAVTANFFRENKLLMSEAIMEEIVDFIR